MFFFWPKLVSRTAKTFLSFLNDNPDQGDRGDDFKHLSGDRKRSPFFAFLAFAF
jgi:hypothetical protein